MSWDSLYTDDFWIRWYNRTPLKITLDWINLLKETKAKNIFDMGCGLGRHTVILAESGFNVTACDTSSIARKITEKELKNRNLHAEVINIDIKDMPFSNNYFDAILSIGVLEHGTSTEIKRAIDEIFRILSLGGRTLASFCPRERWIFKDKTEQDMIEDNTFKSFGPEQTVHHLVDEKELEELFNKFIIHSISMQKEKSKEIRAQELFISAQKSK